MNADPNIFVLTWHRGHAHRSLRDCSLDKIYLEERFHFSRFFKHGNFDNVYLAGVHRDGHTKVGGETGHACDNAMK